VIELALSFEAALAIALPTIIWDRELRMMRAWLRRCWPVVRQLLGWLLICIGGLGVILPGPGIPFLVAGAALVGRRHPLIRRVVVVFKLYVRSWAQRSGLRGWIARRMQDTLREQRLWKRRVIAWLAQRRQR
jgi:hypothetical protein